MGVPCTYPPIEVEGFMVSGHPAPFSRKDFTRPRELREELDRVTQGYEIDVPVTSPLSMRGGEDEFLRQVQRIHDKKILAVNYLLRKHNLDFFMVVFTALDVVQHHFWQYMDQNHPRYDADKAEKYGHVIRDWYIRMDNVIGEIEKLAGKDAHILIMSDHGAGPLYSVFLANQWLRKHGVLTLRRSPMNLNRVVSHVIDSLKGMVFKHIGASIVRNVLNFVPPFLQTKVSVAGSLKRDVEEILGAIDWTKTKAFVFGGVSPAGRVYVNRDILEDEGGYMELRKNVAEKLLRVQDEFGPGCQMKIFNREQIYHGDHSDLAPDLVFYLSINKILYEISGKTNDDELFAERELSGGHIKDGFWALSGPRVKRDVRLDAKIVDLAPTILNLLGVPIPKDMDGVFLGDALEMPGEAQYTSEFSQPKRKEEVFSKEEEDEILRRLKGLGYVD